MIMCVCVCVTVQLPLDHVHPGADLVVKGLDVLQQIQLTLGLGRRTRLRCVRLSVLADVCVCVVLSFHAGVPGRVTVCHSVRLCTGTPRFPVEFFNLYILKQTESFLITT